MGRYFILHWKSYCFSLSGYLYSAFDLQIRSISKYPSYLIMNPGVDALNSKQRPVISTESVSSRRVCVFCLNCFYLSGSVLVGDGVVLVGDDTGLVSVKAPFWRPAFTSAILQWRTGSYFIHLNWMFHIKWAGPLLFYHGLSSFVSGWGSSWRCSQLKSPFSLFRTLVVRNTAALSPSETQTHSMSHSHTTRLRS